MNNLGCQHTPDMRYILEDYDWCQVFETADVNPSDIRDVVRLADGANGGDPWVGIFMTIRGTYLYVYAFCDLTGWELGHSGHSKESSSLEEIARLVCTEDDRERLGLSINPPFLLTQP